MQRNNIRTQTLTNFWYETVFYVRIYYAIQVEPWELTSKPFIAFSPFSPIVTSIFLLWLTIVILADWFVMLSLVWICSRIACRHCLIFPWVVRSNFSFFLGLATFDRLFNIFEVHNHMWTDHRWIQLFRAILFQMCINYFRQSICSTFHCQGG